MNERMDEFKARWRIILAIAFKDVMDAIRNRTVHSIMATAAFLIILYRALPSITESNQPPALVVYDAGDSALMSEFERDEQIALQKATSRTEMEEILGSADGPVLGLVLSDKVDDPVAASVLEIEGTFDHWVDGEVAGELTAFFEKRMRAVTAKSIRISVEQGAVYTQFSGRLPVLVSLSLIILLTMFGFLITPHLLTEEATTRTLDALLTSPATSGQVVIGKAIASSLFCLLAALLFAIMNRSMIVHWGVFLLAGVTGCLFVVSFGLLLGTVLMRRPALSFGLILIQPLLVLPVILESMDGFVEESLIVGLRWIPTVSLARLYRYSMIESVAFADYGGELAFVLVTSFVIVDVVAWLLRRRDLT